ncbi:ZIP family metal transporter [Acetobacter cerevisiae]|uniref:Uncharacterized protein n=1 Tax=Acetobacter cerevisiae TaxID=178900 RepID=A0A149V6Z5_9PROT|nr:ZIP family metal transporter [Acetobacter cerevisiae]KXV76001.1 hypothetical protein AD954_13630 [Acetobacter cerevisiae]
MIPTAYILGVAAGMSTGLGGLLAMRFNRRTDLLLGLTGGCVVGLALMDLLPEALEEGASRFTSTFLAGVMAMGFGLYLLLHRCPAGPVAGRASLLVHSVMDGLGIGLAFQLSDRTGWLVAAAVLGHDMADGANMIGLTALGRTTAQPIQWQQSYRWLLANACAPLTGVVIGQAFHVEAAGFSVLLALFAGGFLYIGTAELLPRSRAANPGLAGGMASVAGLAFMAVILHLTQ